jgi:hypothetical protein
VLFQSVTMLRILAPSLGALCTASAMGGGGGGRTCPAAAPWFTGDPDYQGQNPIDAPLRGNSTTWRAASTPHIPLCFA